MANPMKALNEHFMYNHKLAKTLQQLLSPNERKMIELWFDKLLEMDKNIDQMVIRSDYMWFILLMLQNRRVREPFCRLPPANLAPLKKFVPLHVYEDVLIANEPNTRLVFPTISTDSIFRESEKVPAATSCSSIRY
ncbi:uncharacterized protein [Leptinotarsa decemlineata]|uniref:uncharacterized protein n=1 Tax=Leptinotarsa decemlineata TaxID=7539 RepID=UPI000C254DE2|nr:uncharacterized protein LOC111503601 [Leptinotarsa decemlineata]